MRQTRQLTPPSYMISTRTMQGRDLFRLSTFWFRIIAGGILRPGVTAPKRVEFQLEVKEIARGSKRP